MLILTLTEGEAIQISDNDAVQSIDTQYVKNILIIKSPNDMAARRPVFIKRYNVTKGVQ